jgi:hypothetical protein
MGNNAERRKMQFKRTAVTLLIAAGVAIGIGAISAGAAEPAQVTHDTYCIACHDTSVYTRNDRLADDFDAVREQVDRWQGNISLGWSNEEIDEMTAWLARRYYRMDCPNQC